MSLGIWGILGIVALVVVGVLLWLAGAYNSLVALQNRFKTAFSQIDVQLKRRHDLIPNLIETAKGYLSHEKGTLEAVTQARNHAIQAVQTASANPGSATAMAGLAAAETQLNGVLGRLFAVAEAYPDLKANQNMIALQQELAATENQVASARQIFNNSVMLYNTTLQSFPTNLVAGAFGFTTAQLFELESEKERQVPQVSF
jgi:LemA protein